MLPQQFKANYLTTQNAMKVARMIGNYYIYDGIDRMKKTLIVLIEKESGRSFPDCLNYVNKISENQLNDFYTTCKKFAR